ncbi:MAG: toprim domain-containing protein, partial [Verrucomicrobia bacterium]|nr:toprim domain-containing protein [Verrucomicrobiota bacterium]
HARIIKRFTDEVILCFDSDAAGQSAAIRALDDLLESGLAVRVAVIPSPDDPDSFIKTHGADAFRSLINRAQDFFDFYLDHLCNTNNAQSDKGKLAILFAMGSAARKTGNAVLIDKCAQSTAIRLGVDTTAVRTEFSKISPKYESPTNITSPPEDESKQPPPPPANEFWLLKLLFQDDIPWDWVSGTLNPDWLQHPSVSRIISTTLRYISDGGIPPEISSLLNELEDEYDHSILTQALSDPRPIPQPFVQLKDLILKLRNLHLDRQITPLRTKLDDPNLPNSERDEILIQQHALRIEKSRPLPEISSVKPTQNQDPEPEQNTNEPW